MNLGVKFYEQSSNWPWSNQLMFHIRFHSVSGLDNKKRIIVIIKLIAKIGHIKNIVLLFYILHVAYLLIGHFIIIDVTRHYFVLRIKPQTITNFVQAWICLAELIVKVCQLEETVCVVVSQLCQRSHLGNGMNGVSNAKVCISSNFSKPWIPGNQLKRDRKMSLMKIMFNVATTRSECTLLHLNVFYMRLSLSWQD